LDDLNLQIASLNELIGKRDIMRNRMAIIGLSLAVAGCTSQAASPSYYSTVRAGMTKPGVSAVYIADCSTTFADFASSAQNGMVQSDGNSTVGVAYDHLQKTL
jgi:hypothetical protein